MKIGITGATGQLGRITVAKLKAITSAENLVALVRAPEKAADLGIESRLFDYSIPKTLVESLKDIDKLLFISGSEMGQREIQHKNVIDAAKATGVKEIVYTSLLHADTSSLNLAKEHLATELALKASGITYTILRNGWYTENYLGSLGGALQSGTLVGSAGEGKISSASREDYAEAAINVLTNEIHANKTYELAGDKAYTLSDLAAEASRQTGKTIEYQNVLEKEYTEILIKQGLPDALAASIASWDIGASKDDLFYETNTLSTLLGRPTTALKDTIRIFLEQ
ncbi:NAD(P)H-binding protein [Sphingobacterium sp. DK4209]|uniref:NAD(P)H-binding protein n=1 Tax=Sphingobacterium zhuxiongii TaxID=2662364 RepID=A0A5Q0Q6N1_9SPHI|nr:MULTISPECIES: SDR family oxidoreductase [unclassified Sphingobacterium]MVZ67508.1 NAD(P)H-binding protein [Sphingobacterium sp. DK4209]QGA24904.1 NAD(P)H-binding protein [Sphingobacterium sp. dk4302]